MNNDDHQATMFSFYKEDNPDQNANPVMTHAGT